MRFYEQHSTSTEYLIELYFCFAIISLLNNGEFHENTYIHTYIHVNFTRKHLAFTLAEVLITLGIIGVVAAMTIPTLLNSSQNKEYVVSLKKAYSSLQQAFSNINIEYQSIGNLTGTALFDESTSNKETVDANVFNALSKHIKISKDCGYTTGLTTDECYPQQTYLTGTMTMSRSGRKFITTDGMGISIEDLTGNCSLAGDKYLCAIIAIDVNADKKPNRMGRDSYLFYLERNGNLLPHGYTGTWEVNTTTPTDTCKMSTANCLGKACAAKIIAEGWEMNY